jgi:hypothetical protein
MTFYIQYADEKIDGDNDRNILGEISFKSFYAEKGFKILTKIIEEHQELADCVTIYDNKKKKYTIEEFLDKIEGLKIFKG